MRLVRYIANIGICVYAGITFVAIVRNEFVYDKIHGLVAAIALTIYSWEDIWR